MTDKTNKPKYKRLLSDDYLDELAEYAMAVPGTYQGGSVWSGTGNYGFGGTKQLANQKLIPATKKVANYEVDLNIADQRDDRDYADEYAEQELERIEKKFEDHNIMPEQTISSMSGPPATVPNSKLSKKMEFIPDDSEKTEEESLKDREEEWVEHLATQSQPFDKAREAAEQEAEKIKAQNDYKPEDANRLSRDTSGALGSVGHLVSAKKFVPDEIDRYRDDSSDLFQRVTRRQS